MAEERFCERNVKRWVVLLIVFAILTLTFSIWSAISKGTLNLFTHRERMHQQAMGLSASPVAVSPPAVSPPAVSPPAVSPPANPAQQIALTSPNPQVQTVVSGNMAVSSPPIDAVTQATPMGGIQFVAQANATASPATAEAFTNFNRAADIIRPCVVSINAVRSNLPVRPVFNPNAPRFIDPFDGIPEMLVGQMAFESVGSGVIIDPAGYVVTNYHVVAGATAIIVTRYKREGTFYARIVASDPNSDLSLLQIQGEGPFPVAKLADSSQTEVGDWVLAVGNPFGLEHTVTAGIISGKRSALVIDGTTYRGLLQTDAPINKGSSGGPLVNLNGQVVGISTAIYAPTGVFNGTGFAIPSNRVGAFVARAMTQVTVPVALQTQSNLDTVWLGIGVIDMTAELAAKLSYPYTSGVYVASLVLDSPADEAEITRGDIITAVAGRPIKDGASLRKILSCLSFGQSIPITIWRDGKTETLTLLTRAGRKAGE